MIGQPLASLDAWVEHLACSDIPVLRRTVRELAVLRERQEQVGAREIAAVILQDPLMTVKLLACIEAHRRRSQTTDITTVDRAVMMLGILPFFRLFEGMTAVEERLQAHPQALLGLLRVVSRARRAAHFARDWATLRHDLDVDEITLAALLHDIAEILLWCFAPALAVEVRRGQESDPALRSREAQLAVLGIATLDLQQALCQRWHLPQLLQALMNDAQSGSPRVRNVTRAVALARHLANGTDDAALPDDFKAIGELLHMAPEAVMMRVGIDAYASPPPAGVSRSSAG